jgi:hypothetical protein
MNGAAINSGMGTCGFCGQIGVYTGWVVTNHVITGMDWAGLILVSIVLPAIIAFAINEILRKIGWVKPGDMLLD